MASADKWWKRPLPALDFESTGLDPYSASIVQAGLCAVTPAGKIVGSTIDEILIPSCDIEEGAAKVHGITERVVKEQGRDPGPLMWVLCNRLGKAVSGGYPLVVFNATFDIPLLFTECERRGIPKPCGLRIVDPMIMARKALGRRGGTGLSVLAMRYGLGGQDDKHNAIQDCRLAVGVMHGLLKEYPWLKMPLDELHKEQNKWAPKRENWPWGRYEEPTPQMGFI